MGLHPEPTACVRDAGKKKTRCASCPPQARLKSQGAELSFSGVSVRGGCAGAFPLSGKTGAVRGPALGTNRVCARLKCSHKPGARLARRSRRLFSCSGKQEPGVGLHSERIACVRGSNAATNPERDLPGAAAGFFPARENRSRAWARTRNQPRACAAGSSYLSPFPVWLLPLKPLFICRSGRDGPLLSSEKKVDKDSRGALPLRTPIPVPCGQSFSLPRCWPA